MSEARYRAYRKWHDSENVVPDMRLQKAFIAGWDAACAMQDRRIKELEGQQAKRIAELEEMVRNHLRAE